MGFDEILTTNYSYELEMAALGQSSITDYRLKKMLRTTAKRADTKYLLHNYYSVPNGAGESKLYHIHGEARNPDSIVLGHYYYGNLLCKIIEFIKSNRDSYQKRQALGGDQVNGWIDAFIMHDVYVVGYRFDLSEGDLWWLLNRKCREKAKHGKVFFFEPISLGEQPDARLELLELLIRKDVDDDGDVGAVVRIPVKDENYIAFYQQAFAKIVEIRKSRG